MTLSRRQFAQLALGGTAATAVGVLASKTAAQNTPNRPAASASNMLVLGVVAAQINNPNASATTDSEQTDLGDEGSVQNPNTNVTRTVAIQSFNLANKQVRPFRQTQLTLAQGEEITGFSALSDGTLLVTTDGGTAGKVLRIQDNSAQPVDIRGVNQEQKLESLATAADGSVAGLVTDADSGNGATVVNVNPATGQVQSQQQLPQDRRFSSLVKCPNGTTYSIATGLKGDTDLYNVGTGSSTPLTFNGKRWTSGVNSLVCSGNQLLALAAERYKSPMGLFSIDATSGVMTYLGDYNVAQITMIPTAPAATPRQQTAP